MTPLLASLLLLATPGADVDSAEVDPVAASTETSPADDRTEDEERPDVVAKADDEDADYGPFFVGEAPSDTSFPTEPRRRRNGRTSQAPLLSVGNGAFCFVDGSHCKVSLLADATVAAGIRAPASNKGPDMPYAHFGFRGGLVARPLMISRKRWHPWGVGVVGSWTLGTGAVVVESDNDGLVKDDTERTPAMRVALINQVWLTRKPHAPHIDFTMGAVRSPVLTSGVPLIGTHAELAFGWGGWGAVYAAGDFLDRDTRVSFGFRGHAVAAGPIIALALLGAALGGAL